MSELRKNDFIMSDKGAMLCICGEGGEVVAQMPLSPGLQAVADFWPLLAPREFLTVEPIHGGGMVSVKRGRQLGGVIESAHRFESAVNPDFTPAVMSDAERRAEEYVRKVREQSRTLEARLEAVEREARAAAQLRMPTNPEAAQGGEGAQVVE